MPVAKVTLDVAPPKDNFVRGTYAPIVEALDAVEVNKWICIEITHTGESRAKEMNNTRRACQRWSEQQHIRDRYKLVTQTTNESNISSKLYVKKILREA